jgi:hypothetical protein
MNRQGSVLFEAPLAHEAPTNPSKEPFAVGPGNSVPFAAPPPIGSYWPIKTTGKQGRLVSYKASNGSIEGMPGRMFMANRTGKRGKATGVPRWHVGVDLFAKRGDVVVACEDGTIVGFHPFLMAKSDNQQTYALLIEHSTAVVNYGEVAPDSLDRNNLRVGMKVRAGQPVAFVGNTSMLHFETYIKGTKCSHRWWKDEARPPQQLLNPTKYLLFLQEHGLIGAGTERQPQPLPAAPASQQGIDVEQAEETVVPVSVLRQRIVEIANEEWEKWGRGKKKETAPDVTNYLHDYYFTGVDQLVSASNLRDKKWQDQHPWSAVFISYVMKKAGAGNRFEYSRAHATYVCAAKKARELKPEPDTSKFWAYEITEAKPEVGDLVCKDRKVDSECAGTTYDNVCKGGKAHCDIVVGREDNRIKVIGGNVRQSVGHNWIDLDSHGYLPERAKDGCRYIAVLKSPDHGSLAPTVPSAIGSLTSLPQRIADAVLKGVISLPVALAMLSGQRNVNELTNSIFYIRHPELPKGYKIQSHEKQLGQEWLKIRDQVVQPLMQTISIRHPEDSSGAPVNLGALSSPDTVPTEANALSIMKTICSYHGIPTRVGYTILEHEGGVHLFVRKDPDGVMQTISKARNTVIPLIPRPIRLAVLGLPPDDKASDSDLTSLLKREFSRRLAVQIAVGVQELKQNLDKFNGYVALAFQAYNAGAGWAYYTATRGKAKQRPSGISDQQWEELCRTGAALLHQSPRDLRINPGVWQCDSNIHDWSSNIPVFDKQSGLQLIAFKYLRSISECIRSQKPTSPCDDTTHTKREAGSGPVRCKPTRDGALDKLYNPVKLGERYYQVAQSELSSISDDKQPLKVQNGQLIKMPA